MAIENSFQDTGQIEISRLSERMSVSAAHKLRRRIIQGVKTFVSTGEAPEIFLGPSTHVGHMNKLIEVDEDRATIAILMRYDNQEIIHGAHVIKIYARDISLMSQLGIDNTEFLMSIEFVDHWGDRQNFRHLYWEQVTYIPYQARKRLLEGRKEMPLLKGVLA